MFEIKLTQESLAIRLGNAHDVIAVALTSEYSNTLEGSAAFLSERSHDEICNLALLFDCKVFELPEKLLYQMQNLQDVVKV